MDFSLIELISELKTFEIMVLTFVGTLILFLAIAKRLHILTFLIVLSASFVGTTIPVVENIASLVRWVLILLLFLVGLLQARMKVSLGLFLFWGYIYLGFVFLFRANSIIWQFQRSILLLMVATAIPLAYSIETYKSIKLSLVAISLAGSFYNLLNFSSLPDNLGEATRFSGYLKGAPSFAMVLGGLLPFTFWGLWRANQRSIRITCGIGFLFGVVTLFFSGQRTGTIAGLISLVPLLLMARPQKTRGRSVLLFILLFSLSFILLQQSSVERTDFLFSRYSLSSGLSYRDQIWSMALSEIAESPLLGRGIGAAETVLSYSFHNAYLEVWYNTGILGLVLFLASQFYFIYRIFYLSLVSKDSEIKSVLALVLGYMLGFIFICIFESIGAGASNLNLILYLLSGALVSSNTLFKVPASQVSARSYALNSNQELAMARD